VDAGRILFYQYIVVSLWAELVPTIVPIYGSILTLATERQQAFAEYFQANIHVDGRFNWAMLPRIFYSGMESVGMSMFLTAGLSAFLGSGLGVLITTSQTIQDLYGVMGVGIYPAGLLLFSWIKPTPGSMGVEWAA